MMFDTKEEYVQYIRKNKSRLRDVVFEASQLLDRLRDLESSYYALKKNIYYAIDDAERRGILINTGTGSSFNGKFTFFDDTKNLPSDYR